MKLNKEWHLANRMPANATLQQRIVWQVEHQKNCNWRPIPKKILAEINAKNDLCKRKNFPHHKKNWRSNE